MANKSILEEVTGYRLKVERDGREIINVPGIFALPGVLIAPRASLFGTVAASLLGCSIHLQNEEGKTLDVSKDVKKAAETVADAAKETARSIKEEVDKAWDALSADDPEGCPEGEENAEDGKAAEKSEEASANEEILEDLKAHEEEEVPVIKVNPDDSTKA